MLAGRRPRPGESFGSGQPDGSVRWQGGPAQGLAQLGRDRKRCVPNLSIQHCLGKLRGVIAADTIAIRCKNWSAYTVYWPPLSFFSSSNPKSGQSACWVLKIPSPSKPRLCTDTHWYDCNCSWVRGSPTGSVHERPKAKHKVLHVCARKSDPCPISRLPWLERHSVRLCIKHSQTPLFVFINQGCVLHVKFPLVVPIVGSRRVCP
jgi:hypothetical protein